VKKVLFVCPYPADLVPSQRFRYEQYLSQLKEKGFDILISPFFTQKAYSLFFQSGNLLSIIYAITLSYFKRCLLLFHISPYDIIFVHREATPAGPPIIEYVIAKVSKKRIIYDFDDAIWLTDRTNESFFSKIIRCRWKVRFICKWSDKVSCGNAYLADYARQYNRNVVINPTTIDTQNLHSPDVHEKSLKEKITIGWTGSHTTLKYLEGILPVLQIFERKYPQAKFLIIADKNPKLRLKNVSFRRWKKETEIADLREIDIGLMPMPDDPWTRGKGGFKALQYMAMEIPALVSPVGVNKDIVEHGGNGYWCASFDDWFTRLEELMLNPEKRNEMGKRGRQKVIDHYSVSSNTANFLSLFQ
jgi:glycosyltransferase involved in cell wall biosynthesis